MSHSTPEQPYELFTELWEQNREMHLTAGPDPDFPALTFARLAYAAGWKARAAEESSAVGPPPAEGEVAELVGKLGWIAAQCADIGWPDDSVTVDRAATLLRRLSAAPPPAAGEVAELVEELRGLAEYFSGEMFSSEWIDQLNRAAALLERQAAPVAVPVSERPWDRDGWCDDEGRCWFGAPEFRVPGLADDAGWILRKPSERLSHQSVSLPAHALPLPSGEEA